jgi:hypothetical protein
MSLFIVKRFSLRAMFAVIGLFAVMLVVILSWRAIELGRSNYETFRYQWQSGMADISEVIAASNSLMEAERQSVWITTHASKLNHLERLKELHDEADAMSHLSHSLEARSILDKHRERLSKEIDRLNIGLEK